MGFGENVYLGLSPAIDAQRIQMQPNPRHYFLGGNSQNFFEAFEAFEAFLKGVFKVL